jgi:hypothetical protein
MMAFLDLVLVHSLVSLVTLEPLFCPFPQIRPLVVWGIRFNDVE